VNAARAVSAKVFWGEGNKQHKTVANERPHSGSFSIVRHARSRGGGGRRNSGDGCRFHRSLRCEIFFFMTDAAPAGGSSPASFADTCPVVSPSSDHGATFNSRSGRRSRSRSRSVRVYAATGAALTPEESMEVMKATPLRRWGGAAEIAKTVLFLVDSDFITGECLRMSPRR
jgi:hypothetical protein